MFAGYALNPYLSRQQSIFHVQHPAAFHGIGGSVFRKKANLRIFLCSLAAAFQKTNYSSLGESSKSSSSLAFSSVKVLCSPYLAFLPTKKKKTSRLPNCCPSSYVQMVVNVLFSKIAKKSAIVRKNARFAL